MLIRWYWGQSATTKPVRAEAGTFNLKLASEGLVPLISSKSRVYLLKDCDPVGLSVSESVGFSKWTLLIGRTGFGTM
jgi:hypothetical protein